MGLAVVAHAFNPSTQEAEAVSSRPAWSTRANSRTDSKATEKPCLKKPEKKKKKKKIWKKKKKKKGKKIEI